MTQAPDRFRVELIGQASSHLERLTARAEQLDLRGLLIEVLREMMENLETRPREWGDPYINYRNLNAVGYGCTLNTARLRIAYAVHNMEPLVWLSRVTPLTDSPFKED